MSKKPSRPKKPKSYKQLADRQGRVATNKATKKEIKEQRKGK